MGEHGLNKVTYKVYSDVAGVRQNTTSIDLTSISDVNTYEYASRILKNRFRDYKIKINHVGKTVKVEYKEDERN